jgi:hypothetical protein
MNETEGGILRVVAIGVLDGMTEWKVGEEVGEVHPGDGVARFVLPEGEFAGSEDSASQQDGYDE